MISIQSLENKINEEEQENEARDEIILLGEAAEKKKRELNFERYDTGMTFFDDSAKLENEQGGIAGENFSSFRLRQGTERRPLQRPYPIIF